MKTEDQEHAQQEWKRRLSQPNITTHPKSGQPQQPGKDEDTNRPSGKEAPPDENAKTKEPQLKLGGSDQAGEKVSKLATPVADKTEDEEEEPGGANKKSGVELADDASKISKEEFVVETKEVNTAEKSASKDEPHSMRSEEEASGEP